jgi:uncharacterized protein YbjT (DUF2867 family)
MKILLIGGHGKVALLTEPLLVDAGHTVDAVIRNPEYRDDVTASGATPVVADVEALDVDELAALMQGHDVVIWSAGAGGGNPARTYAVDRDAAIRTMAAAERAGTRRFIMVSYFGAGTDHGIDPSNGFFHYAEAKAAADEHLRRTSLDWTILGPSTLTLHDASGRIDLGATSTTVSRRNVAAVIAHAVTDDSTIRRTIRFNDGDTEIAEALRGRR